jgi:hypothetical protein
MHPGSFPPDTWNGNFGAYRLTLPGAARTRMAFAKLYFLRPWGICTVDNRTQEHKRDLMVPFGEWRKSPSPWQSHE